MDDRFILKQHLRQLADRVVKKIKLVDKKTDDISEDVTSLQTQVNGITIPTKVSQLSNDSGFQTASNVEAFIKNATYLSPEMHRMIFRGKNLGTSLTAAQKTAIQNGTFTDLWLGDYWVIGGVNWRIVDFDYWWNCGDTAFAKHHLVIMPDTVLGDNKPMNTTNTTDGGYAGSLMRTSNINDAKVQCTSAFGNNILSHRDVLCNAVTNGRPSGYVWVDSTIELPTEIMIYGCSQSGVMNDGMSVSMKSTISKSQLALFAVAPKFVSIKHNYWLQDVVSATYFSIMNGVGISSYTQASNTSIGIRTVFSIGVS